MNSLQNLLCLALIFVAAFLSASEVALFSLSRAQLKILKERFRSIYRTATLLQGDSSGVLFVLLVSNEVANIALSILISRELAHHEHQTLLSLVITTPIVLLACEITPKILGARITWLVAPLTLRPLFILYQLFLPIRWIHVKVSSWFPLSAPPKDLTMIKEEDFLSIAEDAVREGKIHNSELQLIRNVFELDDTPVEDISTPLSSVFSIESQSTAGEALDKIREVVSPDGRHFSRIPIYKGSAAKVIGILYSKDLLSLKTNSIGRDTPVHQIMRRPLIVQSHTRLNSVFRKMRQQRTHLALVEKNKYLFGIVTLSDVIDSLISQPNRKDAP